MWEGMWDKYSRQRLNLETGKWYYIIGGRERQPVFSEWEMVL